MRVRELIDILSDQDPDAEVELSIARTGDPHGTVRELIDGGGDSIVMTWDDCIEPFVLTMPPGTPPSDSGRILSAGFVLKSGLISVQWSPRSVDRNSFWAPA